MAACDVVLIGRSGRSTSILFNALNARFATTLLLETPPSNAAVMRSRVRRLGVARVFGQLLFQVFVAMPMASFSKGRNEAILGEFSVSDNPAMEGQSHAVPSVNHVECVDRIHQLRPKVVVINGTRIVSKATLDAFDLPVLNTHVGITPRYRGVHGAYWALVNRDPDHCGVTIHFVDQGIDTGAALKRALITPTKKDNFTTYPTLQMAVGSQLLCEAVFEVIQGTAAPMAPIEGDARWYHPTLAQYVRNRLLLKVR